MDVYRTFQNGAIYLEKSTIFNTNFLVFVMGRYAEWLLYLIKIPAVYSAE